MSIYALSHMGKIKFKEVPVLGKYIYYDLNFGKEVKVTDPCYGNDTWCAYTIPNMQPGKYCACITIINTKDSWGPRVTEIGIVNQQYFHLIKDTEFKRVEGAHIGVDSGQAGFFDNEMFSKLERTEKDRPNEVFYDECCALTRKEGGPLASGKGFVSSSGFGDGGYDLFTVEKDGEVIAAKVVFISDEEEEEDNGQ